VVLQRKLLVDIVGFLGICIVDADPPVARTTFSTI
jgi:hypothetical protein